MTKIATPTTRKRAPNPIRTMCQTSRRGDSVHTIETKKINSENKKANIGL